MFEDPALAGPTEDQACGIGRDPLIAKLWDREALEEHGIDVQAKNDIVTARLEVLEVEMGNLRQELSETQERLDFAERLLAQRAEPRRVGPER